MAKYKMIIYSCFVYQSDFLLNSTATSPLEMDIEMNAFVNLQSKLDTTNFSFSVPFSMTNEYIFDSPFYTTFKIMLLMYDKFPTFAIRVQFIETRICTPQHSIDHIYVPEMYKVGHDFIHRIGDNISDVYLSPRHPYDQLATTLYFYEGYDHGTCRIIVSKHKCSLLKPQYQIIKIHYHPHKTLVTPQEVDSSLKKTPNCTIACALDIGILEYSNSNSFRKM